MKAQKKIPKKGAACLQQTAGKTKLHSKPYLKAVLLSSFKLQIGQLLLNLHSQSEPQRQWQVFESKLRQYIDLKLCEVNL